MKSSGSKHVKNLCQDETLTLNLAFLQVWKLIISAKYVSMPLKLIYTTINKSACRI
jgi:hypothetical protein